MSFTGWMVRGGEMELLAVGLSMEQDGDIGDPGAAAFALAEEFFSPVNLTLSL